ncbi:MAG: hypothetical protein DRG31_00895, partial [Deltaproteobacteria bacterium]
RDFDRPFEEVWRSTIEGLTRAGEFISFSEKDSGLIVVEKELSGDDLPGFIMGGPALVVWHRGSVKGSIFVKPLSENSTRVFVNVKIKGLGTPLLGKYPIEYALASNGRMEKTYLDLIEGMVLASRKFEALERRYHEAVAEDPEAVLGIKTKALTEEVVAVLGLESSTGVLIVAVKEGSPAEDVGLQKGDVILEVEGQRIASLATFRELVRRNVNRDALAFKIMRRGKILTVKVPLP